MEETSRISSRKLATGTFGLTLVSALALAASDLSSAPDGNKQNVHHAESLAKSQHKAHAKNGSATVKSQKTNERIKFATPNKAKNVRKDATYDKVKLVSINTIGSNAKPTLSKKKATQVKFNLADVKIVGAKSLPAEELLELTNKLVKGQATDLHKLNKIAQKMTKKFHKEGYILTHVEVDQKAPANGVVTFNVIEGYVTKVEYKGEIKGSKSILDGYGEKMITGEPAKRSHLERYILLAERLPGAVFKNSVLTPVKGSPGAFKLVRELSHNMAGGSVGVDSRGTKSKGPYNITYNHRIASGFGLYEQFEAGFAATADTGENFSPNIKYSQYLGSEGLKFLIAMNSLGTSSSYKNKVTRISESANFSAELSYPIIYTQLDKLTAKLKFAYKNSGTTPSNRRGITRDRLRTGELSADYEKIDAFRGRMTYNAALTQGFNMWGSTSDSIASYKSSPIARAKFTKVTGSVQRLQQITKGWDLLVAVKGQHTNHNLFGSEKFSYGGGDMGRGFDGGVASGDRGYSGKIELDWTTKYNMPFLNRAVWFVFYDGGQTYTRTPKGAERVMTGQSTGVGCKLTITKNLSGFIELNKPIRLKVAPTLSMQPRVFGGLTAKFDL